MRKNCFLGRALLIILFNQCLLVRIASALEERYLRGENATLTCAVDTISGKSAGRSPKHYTWFKHTEDGKRILLATSVSGESTISEDGPLVGRASFEPPVLHIRDLVVTDSATYSCDVIGTSYQSSKTVLKVNAIPSISVDVASSPTLNRESKQYEAAVCRASEGNPAARILWIRTSNGEVQDSEESVETLPDGTYTVKSRLKLSPGLLGRRPNATEQVTVHDTMKNFTCLVSHDYFAGGKDQSKTVLIKLLYPPVVTIAVQANRLTCNAFGNPSPTVAWTRPDGVTIAGMTSIYVDQRTPTSSSGRYVCVAKSSIAPEAVSAINVQKSRDLPTLFTNTLRYNASLPVKARGYEMECTAELESLTDVAVHRVTFEWTKNGKLVDELSPYQVTQKTVPISTEKSIVTSILRMIDVRRHRDEGLFKCRLSLPAIATGYVRAVERSIQVTVDYPPSTVKTTIRPSDWALEFTNVELTCSAVSSPQSSYQWFFNGVPKSTGPVFNLRNVSREEAGLYKCVAYNYVPGSASKDVKLTVKYPPGEVIITRTSQNLLSCTAKGGSVPPPYYTWLMPNGSATVGNKSILKVPTFDVSVPTDYICLVSNGLDQTSNHTCRIAPVTDGRIGALSVGEFVVTVIVCLLLLILMLVAVVWVIRHQLNRGGAISKTKKDFDAASTALANGTSTVMSPKPEGRPSLVNFATFNSKSNLPNQNGPDVIGRHKKYKSVEELGGCGVEILENSLMKSATISREREKNMLVTMGQRNGIQNSPVKLSTFSSPDSGNEDRPNTANHYNTARNPKRGDVEQARPMARTLSEGFRPVLFDDTMRPEKRDNGNAVDDQSAIVTSGNDIPPPTYSALHVRSNISSPQPIHRTQQSSERLQKGAPADKDGSSSDSSSTPSTTRRMSQDRAYPGEYHPALSRALTVTETSLAKQNSNPVYRYNTVSHDPYRTYHPDQIYRPSPASSPRAQTVGYDRDFTPPMPEIPVRNYLYHPYVEARLGIPLSAQQQQPKGGGSTATSPYDSGSDSAKSSGTTATTTGRRLQSLTLV